MPSGARKRKAAKKKKEKEAINAIPSAHPQGDDGPKTHDEKESDGGEVSSPMSQDQHPLTEGVVEDWDKRKDTSSVRSFNGENKAVVGVDHNGESIQKVAIEEAGVVQIDSNLKPKDYSDSKSVDIEYVRSLRETQDRGSSWEYKRLSSSSSDDDSNVVDKNIVVVEDEAYSSVSATAPFVASVGPADPLPEVVADCIPVQEAYHMVVESVPIVHSDKVSLSEEVVQIAESAPVENSATSDAIEFGLKDNGKNRLPSVDGVSPVVMNLGSQVKENKVLSGSNGKEDATASDAKGFTAQENEDKLLPSSNDSRPNTDSRLLASSAPQAVQRTSWKSCCGLFEAFTASNR